MSLADQLSKGAKVLKDNTTDDADQPKPPEPEPRPLRPEEILDSILPIRVRPTLNSMFGVLNGGISTAIDYLRRHVRHPEHGKVVASYIEAFDAHSPTKREKFDMEHWAHELEIDPSELCGWIMMELHRFGRDMAQVIVQAHQPYIAARLVKEALYNEDLTMLERMGEKHGLLNPKQPQSVVNVRASANSTSDARALSMQDAGLPSFADDMNRAPSLVKSQLADDDHLLPEADSFPVEFEVKEAEYVQR